MQRLIKLNMNAQKLLEADKKNNLKQAAISQTFLGPPGPRQHPRLSADVEPSRPPDGRGWVVGGNGGSLGEGQGGPCTAAHPALILGRRGKVVQ